MKAKKIAERGTPCEYDVWIKCGRPERQVPQMGEPDKIIPAILPVKEKREGFFQEIGVDVSETECGIASFSTAVIMRPDGALVNIPVEDVKIIIENVE